LAPVLRERGGLWIGWSGIAEKKGLNLDRLLHEAVQGAGYMFKPVPLTEKEVAGYDYGFANEIL